MRHALLLSIPLAGPLVLGGCSKTTSSQPAAATLKIAAASDLAVAFPEVGAAFERSHPGAKVVFSFGSTGLLAKQIREGAPFDVFAAANVSFVDEVVRAGACDGSTRRPYARGRIVAWWRDGLAAPPQSLAELADARFTKIAIANPEHAPYGQAAREALIAAGAWEAVRPKLVFGENVQQTLQFAETGNADVALVALSLALARAQAQLKGHHFAIDPSSHRPIDQALVVCGRGAGAGAGAAFAAFVDGAEGRAIMRRHGFLLPGETAAPQAK